MATKKKKTKVAAKAKGSKTKKSAGTSKTTKKLAVKKPRGTSPRKGSAAASKTTGKKSVGHGLSKSTKLDFFKNQFLTPLDDRIVLIKEEAETTTPGGLWIPNTASESSHFGIVIAVGRGRRDKKGKVRPMDVRVGDRVLLESSYGTTLKWQNQDVMILREEEVLGVIS